MKWKDIVRSEDVITPDSFLEPSPLTLEHMKKWQQDIENASGVHPLLVIANPYTTESGRMMLERLKEKG